MKFLKIILLCGACFLVAATVTCILRVTYRWLPDLKESYAFDYADNVERYSFLQYSQAGPEQGKKALLQYIELLERIRRENITYPQNLLHRDLALTYLRLYRIESTAGNTSTADNYMKSAQKELLAQGAKEQQVSPEALTKLIEAREFQEDELYDQTPASGGPKKSNTSNGKSK